MNQRPTLSNPMVRAYRQWCKHMDPHYKASNYPLRGRMFTIWCDAWMASARYIFKGDEA